MRRARDTGLRPTTSPGGKYNSLIEEYIYEGVVLNGFSDDTVTFGDGDDTYDGVLAGPDLVKALKEYAEELGDKLTPEEAKEVRSLGGVIFHVDSQGFVSGQWYSTEAKYKKAIAKLEAEAEALDE